MRRRLYDTGTAGLRRALQAHLSADDTSVTLAPLTGAVLVRVTFEAQPAGREFLSDLVDRTMSRTSTGIPTD